jgi:urea carboxylase
MLAKVIVHADTREEALDKLSAALQETRLYGVTTNLQYIQTLLQEENCRSGHVHTQMLKGFSPAERAIEVLDGGIQTTVQDWPGRVGHWDVGVPPCGPMDPFAFRIGNKLLGNDERAAGLELTLRGGSYRFRGDLSIVLTGADMKATLDETEVPMFQVSSHSRKTWSSFIIWRSRTRYAHLFTRSWRIGYASLPWQCLYLYTRRIWRTWRTRTSNR